MHPKNISITDFTYDLPNERIATYPKHPRDSSKLLVYNNGTISHDVYSKMSDHLPKDAVLVFNNTRVINSRIHFRRETGALIELFLLEPQGEQIDYATFFQQQKSAVWKCFVGNANKWKEQFLVKNLAINRVEVELKAELVERIPGAYLVELSWTPEHLSIGEIVEEAGVTPLPPYIKRKAEEEDTIDYQTVYSKHEGSVAAPTAGLHFSDAMLEGFKENGIESLFTTLHVGAGTFKPVSSETMEDHIMHAEWMTIDLAFLNNLLTNIDKPIISVGTTATRTLESIYWMGNKILNHPNITSKELKVTQWEPYDVENTHTPKEALSAFIAWMKTNNQDHLIIETEIIIAPSYSFKIINGLVTNFHQPQSTLLLLVAALLGKDWRKVYGYAMDNDFRFLSYGDGSLLLP